MDTHDFLQSPPRLPHPWLDDPLLASALRRRVAPELEEELFSMLHRFAERVVGEVRPMGEDAQLRPPLHVPFDPWGARVDRLELAAGWQGMKAFAAEEGLVATGYEDRWGERSRLVQHSLLYLFGPDSAIFTCPLAMTDGAARLIDTSEEDPLRRGVRERLVSRDPQRFWTSGQWMTERTGGSDVGESETRAEPAADGSWRLFGSKWFTSAVDADVAFTLARPPGAASGSRGLALFWVEVRDEEGCLRGIRVERLKDKLGTRALPTAELTLEGTPARIVGEVGEGVRRITPLLNVTRLHNATAAAGLMRRGVHLARDYATRRRAFGRLLIDQPLHRETLADLECEAVVAMLLVLATADLVGQVERGCADEAAERRLRAMVPLVKLFTGKQAVAVASEVLEAFGGAGYIEDTGLPTLLRDSQVLSIWEGTTNVLALDLLRATRREDALSALVASIGELIATPDRAVADAAKILARRLAELTSAWDRAARAEDAGLEARARRLALGLGRILAGALLVDQAGWSVRHGEPEAGRWCGVCARWNRQEIRLPVAPSEESAALLGALP